MKFVILFVLCIILLETNAQNYRPRPNRPQFRVSYEWSLLDYDWPSDTARQQAISNRDYIPINNAITGVEFWDNKLFVTVPRLKAGVPSTLNWIPSPNMTDITAPLLIPFPSWEANQNGNCRALQNVQSVEIDTKGVLWVIDGGRTNTMEQYPVSLCSPRLILYDLSNGNKIIREYIFPEDVALKENSFLNDLVIDEYNGGFAYITDSSRDDPGIIVYSYVDNVSWKVREPNTMRAATEATEFIVNGTRVKIATNLDGIALGPLSWGPERDLFYTPLSSYHMYAISSAVLRNRELATSNAVIEHVRDLGTKSSQTDGMIMDENGILYYGLLGDTAVGYWNTSYPFSNGQRLLAKDGTYIQWPDSFAIDPSGNMYLVTNRLQNFLARNIRADEGNYRILTAYVGRRSYLYGHYGTGALSPQFSSTFSPISSSFSPVSSSFSPVSSSFSPVSSTFSPVSSTFSANYPSTSSFAPSTYRPSSNFPSSTAPPFVNIYPNGQPSTSQDINRYDVEGSTTTQYPLQGFTHEYNTVYNSGSKVKLQISILTFLSYQFLRYVLV